MIKKYTGGMLYSDINRETWRWIEHIEPDEAEPFVLWICENCGTVEKRKTPYCPFCGAKMEV